MRNISNMSLLNNPRVDEILISLKINNWNENRKNQRFETEILFTKSQLGLPRFSFFIKFTGYDK